MSNGEYRELFLFAAKAGALEGYLYDRQKVESLTNWVGNISRMYHELSPAVAAEIRAGLTPVLERILKYGEGLLDTVLKDELQKLLAASGKES